MSANEPTNTDDILDSRDVIIRIDDMEMELEAGEDIDEDELNILKELAEEGESLPDWEFGVVLVRDSYFEDYAQDFADDIGAIDASLGWPMSCIDWEQAARELQMDYTAIEFDGVTYWAR